MPVNLRAVRHPKRGLAHRLNKDAYSSTLYPDSTVCGRFARDMTESLPITQADPYDRCVRCWADTQWPAKRD